MRLTLDACVAVAAVQTQEPTHAAAKLRVARVVAGDDEMVVPALFQVEVASALTRAGWDAAGVATYVDTLISCASHVVTIGPRSARAIQRIAMKTRLRAADAAYVWVASREHAPLVTLDQEVLTRGGTQCEVEAP